MRLGLIVNPLAGIGGRVGLKGSDGAAVQQQALALGAAPQAHLRAAEALKVLQPRQAEFELVTAPGRMGENIAREGGFNPQVIGGEPGEPTSAEDTIRCARAMRDRPVDLLLFAGGDGTARDIFDTIGTTLPALGIPAGVKIYSAVFATHPRTAGEAALAFLDGRGAELRQAEVIDLDEETYRQGVVVTRLYGWLRIPYQAQWVQNRKAPTPAGEAVRMQGIAASVAEALQPGWYYVLGPGTTTQAIADYLGWPKTLVGVDVYSVEGVVALDVNEARLQELVEQRPVKVIVTPIGGQGFLFGRGNQQIGPEILRQAGQDNLWVVSLVEKLNALQGKPLLVDTGDPGVDQLLAGYLPVTVGYRDKVIYRLAACL